MLDKGDDYKPIEKRPNVFQILPQYVRKVKEKLLSKTLEQEEIFSSAVSVVSLSSAGCSECKSRSDSSIIGLVAVNHLVGMTQKDNQEWRTHDQE